MRVEIAIYYLGEAQDTRGLMNAIARDGSKDGR